MKNVRIFIAISLNLLLTCGFAQYRSWGDLLFPISGTWSIRQTGKQIELSNYNTGEPTRFTITLFEKKAISGKPDSLFAIAWRTHLNRLPRTDFVPRWKRVYTDEGMLILQGFMEFSADAGGPLYRQLNVYVMEQHYQACLLEMEGVTEYKKIQTDWLERIRGATRTTDGKD